MKKLFFLSGIPRSGSTLLGSILNQNEKMYVSPTSPLGDLLSEIDKILYGLTYQYTYDVDNVVKNISNSIIINFYNHIEKPYVIDKHRCWPLNIESIKKFTNIEPKIIATYRPIPEAITSYISLIERTKYMDNFIDEGLKNNHIEITNTNRCEYIWKQCLTESYESLVYGLTNYPDSIHLINYNDFIENPQEEVKKIYDFLEVEEYEHNFDLIKNTCSEKKDKEWGLIGLHDIRSSLSRISQDPIEVIGEENVNLYSKFNL